MELRQHHCYIPLVILREFQGIPRTASSISTSVPEKRRGKQQQLVAKSIYSFDLSTCGYTPGTLTAQCSAFATLHPDATTTATIHHIEDQFSCLESDAVRVIEYLQSKVTNGESSVVLLREDLYCLRKFLFLLHIQSSAAIKTPPQEDHTDNAPIRRWIPEQKTHNNIPSDVYPWLNGLEYYLDTPTDQILLDAQRRESKVISPSGPSTSNPNYNIDPATDIKYRHAKSYELFHNWYYLAICRAAPDQEFVLCHNSLGLSEGILAGKDDQVHRLYILGPRIAIIFRSNMTKDPIFNMMMVDSTLNGIPFNPPITHYSASPRLSLDDTFMFQVHQLTRLQTYKVNKIMLEKMPADGILTFLSGDKMLATLAEYEIHGPSNSFTKPHRAALGKLKDLLLQSVQSRRQSSPGDAEGRFLDFSSTFEATSMTPKGDEVSCAHMGRQGCVGSGSSGPTQHPEIHTPPALVASPSPESSKNADDAGDHEEEAVLIGHPKVKSVEKGESEPRTLCLDHPESPAWELPRSLKDDFFDAIFKESLTSWNQRGRQTDLTLLSRVYSAIGNAEGDNHPIALRIRYMISDAIRRRSFSEGNKVQFPCIVPKTDLDVFLNDTGLTPVFNIAVTMAMADGLFVHKEGHHPIPEPSTALIFLRQVAVYGYLRDWLYPNEFFRLIRKASRVPGLVSKSAPPSKGCTV